MPEYRAFQTVEPPSRRARRIRLLALLGFVGLCLLVMVANGSLSGMTARGWYQELRHPPGTPPAWVFGPVWTALYLCIGVSAWLVWRRVDVGVEAKRQALRRWGWQLLANALWPAAFFGLHAPRLALAVIAAMLVTIALTFRAFRPLHRGAAWLLAPYFAWTCYAAWLNAGVAWLNPGG